MTPIITLVGRPNVGKSTLFNRLTRSRDALVDNRPGVTRDRLYGEAWFGSQNFWVVDTGGLEADADELHTRVSQQVMQAVEECDAVFFITDTREGCTPADEEIAGRLRRTDRPLRLIVNKAEGMNPDMAAAEFHRLGLGTPYAVSAEHGEGISHLLEDVLPTLQAEQIDPWPKDLPRVAVIGRPNAGKSTLINALIGEERLVVFDTPGTTRDSVPVEVERDSDRFIFIDTAGVRRRARVQDRVEKFSVIKALQAAEQSQVVVLVTDASRGVSEQDLLLAGIALRSGRAMVLVVNKWDGLGAHERSNIRRELARKLNFLHNVQPLFVSALHGGGLGTVVPAVRRAYESTMTSLSTPILTRALHEAVQSVPPPIKGRFRIKLKYAHQGGKNPPTVIIHGNGVAGVPASYRRYLSNFFTRRFRLEGVSMRVEFKRGSNPFTRRGPRSGGRK